MDHSYTEFPELTCRMQKKLSGLTQTVVKKLYQSTHADSNLLPLTFGTKNEKKTNHAFVILRYYM